MIKIRKSGERGLASHGWLKSRHTFSFADYLDPHFMGFSDLRVINEDRIEGGTGFGEHSHKNMEILSYVITGELAHKDSMGNATRINPGEVQRLSAGLGIRHSEHNAFANQTTHFLQIWILPEKLNIVPGYGQKNFAGSLANNELTLVASQSGRDGSISINQDAEMYLCKANAPGEKKLVFADVRNVWVQVIQGPVQVEDSRLSEGDGASLEKVRQLKVTWEAGSEFILFSLR